MKTVVLLALVAAVQSAGLETYLPKSLFQSVFPNALPIYSYENMIAVSKIYPAFANTGNVDVDKREVAAFLGQIALESGYLQYVEEINKSTMCQASADYPCAPGKQYFGRGPIQLSWNYNYKDFGIAAGKDLVANPDLVAQDPQLVWWSAYWFWNVDKWNGNIHDVVGQPGGFAYTTYIINGGLECGPNPANKESEKSRIANYIKFANLLGVAPGDNLSCQTSAFPPSTPWPKPVTTKTPPSTSPTTTKTVTTSTPTTTKPIVTPAPTTTKPIVTPAPTTTKPIVTPTTTPPPSNQCNGNRNVCFWPLTQQVLPYAKSDCQLFPSFVWCD
ncbi:hypothetical protein H257_02278 [Aphanomyces astaci]|uniref:Glycoside hydrolase family 19 catalytic domain-containing protein n=2 Tax=Aphanomyces astaci TaxID=112090 RepID=W4H1A0_APHAT|nr:hypothetical protein H257_02278 [Aphanomyces astaci]ETV85667.1 hypothetical protein H257_02278 [Aphanomyces astaci]|eukprot:XP_009824139.1 hypothetical protein H257_02278 [Aphanomyces astaci]